MIEINNNRLIGDYIEINADIVKYRHESKLPKLIKNRIASNKINKLIKSVEKLRNSNYVLETKNITELFAYIYNNYPPNGNYKSIKTVKFDEKNNMYVAVIRNNNILCSIDLPLDSSNTFEITAKKINDNVSWNGCSITATQLHSSNSNYKDILNLVNKELLNIMCDYIIDALSLYKGV